MIALGWQPSEDLPEVATEALVDGYDSPALRHAAGIRRQDVVEARDVFLVALDELGIAIPSEEEACWEHAREVAHAIVNGHISPRQGASELWQLWHRMEREGDLRIFVGLASEWDDHPKLRTKYEVDIIAEARALLSRSEPRTWIQLRVRHECPPVVWWPGGEFKSVDASALPISNRLRSDVERWSDDYGTLSRPDNPGPGHFETVADAVAFAARGRDLQVRLQEELGDGWVVEYQPVQTRWPRGHS